MTLSRRMQWKTSMQRLCRVCTVFLFLVFLLFSNGCGDPINQGKEGDPCYTHTDCGSGLICDCPTQTCRPVGEGNPSCGIPDAGPPVDAYITDADLPDATSDGEIEDDGSMEEDAAMQEDATIEDEDGEVPDGTVEDASA